MKDLNKLFKLTALSAAVMGLAACGSDDDSSGASAANACAQFEEFTSFGIYEAGAADGTTTAGDAATASTKYYNVVDASGIDVLSGAAGIQAFMAADVGANSATDKPLITCYVGMDDGTTTFDLTGFGAELNDTADADFIEGQAAQLLSDIITQAGAKAGGISFTDISDIAKVKDQLSGLSIVSDTTNMFNGVDLTGVTLNLADFGSVSDATDMFKGAIIPETVIFSGFTPALNTDGATPATVVGMFETAKFSDYTVSKPDDIELSNVIIGTDSDTGGSAALSSTNVLNMYDKMTDNADQLITDIDISNLEIGTALTSPASAGTPDGQSKIADFMAVPTAPLDAAAVQAAFGDSVTATKTTL